MKKAADAWALERMLTLAWDHSPQGRRQIKAVKNIGRTATYMESTPALKEEMQGKEERKEKNASGAKRPWPREKGAQLPG